MPIIPSLDNDDYRCLTIFMLANVLTVDKNKLGSAIYIIILKKRILNFEIKVGKCYLKTISNVEI